MEDQKNKKDDNVVEKTTSTASTSTESESKEKQVTFNDDEGEITNDFMLEYLNELA